MRANNYTITKLGLVLLSLLPLWPLLWLLFAPNADGGRANFFADVDFAVIIPYILTSINMVAVIGLLAVAIGILLAWWFAFFTFPGKKILSWLVLLPFALPPYISAMVYIEQLSPSGWLGQHLQGLLHFLHATNPRDWRLAAVVLAMSFYPYVYLLARAFLSSSHSLTSQIEMARVLGYAPAQCFWRLFLPMMIPQMLAGFILVGLEVMADYGAMNFFAVKTLSMGMFDLWLNLGQVAYARYFCLVILLWVLLFLAIDYAVQGFYIDGWRVKRKSTAATMTAGHGGAQHRAITPSRGNMILMLLFIWGLLLFAFGLPLLSLLSWWLQPLFQGTNDFTANVLSNILPWLTAMGESVPAMFTSFGFALVASATMLLIVLAIGFAERLARANHHGGNIGLIKLPLVVGYAMPGVVLGLSILIFSLSTIDLLRHFIGKGAAGVAIDHGTYNIMLGGLLFYGYVAKFSASAFGAVNAGYRAIGPNLDQAARVLGQPPMVLFANYFSYGMDGVGNDKKNHRSKKFPRKIPRKIIGGLLGVVHLPLLRPALLSAFLLTFVEVIKELPITLVLRPFGIETLALRLFTLVSDERIKMAALPALLIMLVSGLSIWLTRDYWLKRNGL
ncbi:MAG: ABC transporter permease subunit [Hydrotalea sp.]|nr:ABC transporter permease subunit [Hydrotalea sp.]